MSRVAIVSIIFVVLMVVFVVTSSVGSRAFTCEACVTFAGRQQCRTAVDDERMEAIRLATDNACAFLASGRDESIRCGNTPPDRVVCAETQH